MFKTPSNSPFPSFLAPKRRGPARLADPRPLFEDTSATGASPGRGFGAPPPPSASSASSSSSSSAGFGPPGAFLAEPVSSLAAAYGSSLASHVEGNVRNGNNGGEKWGNNGGNRGEMREKK